MPFLIIKYWLFLSFLTFLFAIFNNSPYSTYVTNFYIDASDVIRPLRGICDKEVFTEFFLTVLLLVLLLQLISMWIAVFTFLFFLNFYALRSICAFLDFWNSLWHMEVLNWYPQFFVFVGPIFNSIFHVFIKHKRDLRLKYVHLVLFFLSLNFYLSFNLSYAIVCNFIVPITLQWTAQNLFVVSIFYRHIL